MWWIGSQRAWNLKLIVCAVIACASIWPPGSQASAGALEVIQQDRARLESEFAAQLERLAAACEAQGLTDEARKSRQLARPRDPWTLYVVALSGDVDEDLTSSSDAPAARQWEAELRQLGETHAAGLLELARQAMRAKHASLGYELVLAMLRVDPDNEQGRKLLGFIRYKGRWHTPFEVEKLRKGQVWHEQFGWLPAGYVSRYEAGERYCNGRWISREEETRLRSDMSRAWHVETEHYSIRTNHSLEAGVKLGQRLEQLYRAWQQTFAAYYASPEQLLRLFEGRGAGRGDQGPRHLVTHFRNREEYHRALEGHIPRDVATTGIYLGDMRTAYFFATDDEDHSTLYHEASHQLFSETRDVVANIGLRANFWIVEGVACYMESLAQHGGFDTLGGTRAPRLAAARHRALADQFYVPLEQLTLLGMPQLQRDPRIAKLYSQSAGLTHFLMHFHDGLYRDALLGYISAVYSGVDRPGTLAELTGKSYSELDREYREFLEQLPIEAAAK